ncbi:uncharacterized protein LOC100383719 [Zea mays]|uniref:Uncharacterized protein n=1 Tax=Zea mays TaxID=4577 RepID=C0PIJ0_MAIZE|nr:uncharacterized protein LOC100383719 [Zea mays]ACN35006.1 unknown [Zea mays]|eukprot:NP_001169827.1 uncharacterized protein LOC100383719 [Zea mays]
MARSKTRSARSPQRGRQRLLSRGVRRDPRPTWASSLLHRGECQGAATDAGAGGGDNAGSGGQAAARSTGVGGSRCALPWGRAAPQRGKAYRRGGRRCWRR